jgi:phosphoribosylformimino-5-aminoimidazole carboxamide ribotide isomerase
MARRIAWPSAAQDAGKGQPASPPPVTHSWIRIVVVGVIPGGADLLMSIRLIPVLDLKAGRAVRAIGGDRAHYQPLATRLHAGPDPVGVARGFRDALGLREMYLADLDAIAGGPPSRGLYQAIRALGHDLWVDAGIRDRATLAPLLDPAIGSIVAGLETVRGPSALGEILAAVSADRLVFSLDLRDGAPLIADDAPAWGTTDPFALARSAVALGVRRLLLLDLSRVGTGRGTGTLALVASLRALDPDLEISAGGGIADRDDVRRLAQAGASVVLIGSAFHDGRIVAADLAGLIGQDGSTILN